MVFSGQLLSLLVFLLSVCYSEADTYYVKPSSSVPCPVMGIPCNTLSQYATMQSTYFATNTTLILLPGSHNLDTELWIGDIQYLAISTVSHLKVPVTCAPYARFNFDHIDEVLISGIAFFGCVDNNISLAYNVELQNCSFQGQQQNGTGLVLYSVVDARIARCTFSQLSASVQGQGGGLTIDICEQVMISETSFFNNTAKLNINSNAESDPNLASGGAIFVHSSQILTVISSRFEFNSVVAGPSEIGAIGGALSVIFYDIFSIQNSTFIHNTVQGNTALGGAMSLQAHAQSQFVTISISDSTFTNNTATGVYSSGGAMFTHSEAPICIEINNSTFNGNTVNGDTIGYGGAVFVTVISILSSSSSNITVTHSMFTLNVVTGTDSRGGAVHIEGDSESESVISAHIHNSEFHANEVNGEDTGFGGAVYASYSNVSLSDSNFIGNNVDSLEHAEGGAVFTSVCNVTTVGSWFAFNSVLSQNDM